MTSTTTTKTSVAGSEEDERECRGYRWAVKIAADPDADLIDVDHVVPSTVDALTALPAAPRAADRRVRPTETTVFEIHTTARAFQLQDDGDIHLVVGDSQSRTMIAELPLPRCAASGRFGARSLGPARPSPTGTGPSACCSHSTSP